MRSDIERSYVHALDQTVQPDDIAVHIADQQHDALKQLGDQHKQKSGQEQKYQEHSRKYGECPLESLVPEILKDPLLKRGSQRIDQICDHAAVKNGYKVPADIPQEIVYDAQVGQRHITHNADHDRDSIVIPFSVLELVFLHQSFV